MPTDLNDPIFTDDDAARAHLEGIHWPNGPVCPHCGERENVKRLEGEAHRAGLVQCNSCRQQFTVTIGTVLERSKIPLHKWVMAMHLLCSSKKGMSAHQLHRMLGVSYKAAWFMAYRLREAMKEDVKSAGGLGGEGKVIEADETFIGLKEGKKHQRGTAHKNAVLSLVERGGKVRSVHIKDLTKATVVDIIRRNADRASQLMTDEAMHYRAVGKEFAKHGRVHHALGEYVSHDDPTVHSNTIEGFFSIFKRGMKGIYQHCGEQHLQRYLAEFDFRYNHRIALGFDDSARAELALLGMRGKRLTYRRPDAAAHA